jgi:hypothetical protein
VFRTEVQVTEVIPVAPSPSSADVTSTGESSVDAKIYGRLTTRRAIPSMTHGCPPPWNCSDAPLSFPGVRFA